MMKCRQIAPMRWTDPLPWLAAAAAAWLVLVLASPFEPPAMAFVVYGVGRRICHQIAERSFHVGGIQLAVCARCTGIYAGAALCLIGQLVQAYRGDAANKRWSLLTTGLSRRWLIVGAVPTLLTVTLEQIAVWHPSNVVRAISGAPLGIAVTLVVGSAATLHYEQWRQRRLV